MFIKPRPPSPVWLLERRSTWARSPPALGQLTLETGLIIFFPLMYCTPPPLVDVKILKRMTGGKPHPPNLWKQTTRKEQEWKLEWSVIPYANVCTINAHIAAPLRPLSVFVYPLLIRPVFLTFHLCVVELLILLDAVIDLFPHYDIIRGKIRNKAL